MTTVPKTRVTTTKPQKTERASAVRPPAIRVDWELDAPWHAVRFVEEGGMQSGILKDELQPGRGPDQIPAVHQGYKAIAGDVKAFLNAGKSSLTPYEATVIAMGLGFGGTQAVDKSEKARLYQRGDRVSFEIALPGEDKLTKQSGIAVQGGIMTTDPRNGRITLLYPEYDDGSAGRLFIDDIKVTAQAKQDGRQERVFGA